MSDTNHKVDLQSIFERADFPVLSNIMRDSLEGPLTHQEILNALTNTTNGKSPGSDGFSFEFYKLFFSDLSWYLLRSLNAAYETGTLSVTQQNMV